MRESVDYFVNFERFLQFFPIFDLFAIADELTCQDREKIKFVALQDPKFITKKTYKFIF